MSDWPESSANIWEELTGTQKGYCAVLTSCPTSRGARSYLAGMCPYISLKIKKRHYEHHMIEAHKYLITWISDDIFFENSG
jgi:hypothetical protein